MSNTSPSLQKNSAHRRWRPRALSLLAPLALATLTGTAAPAHAASLDGAGRIVIVPYVVSGLERESTLYVTNGGSLVIKVYGKYIGADGTPLAASVVGEQICGVIRLNPGESQQVSASQLCPLGTPDVENFGYLELSTFGGFDTNPFFATSVVNTRNGDQFGVEGFPVGAVDPSMTSADRANALRVIGLEGEVPTPPATSVEKQSHCYLGALGEDKDVTVRLMEYSTGSARPLGRAMNVRLKRWTMSKLSNVLATAGAPPMVYSNVTAEIYTMASTPGAAVIAACSVETLRTGTEDFRAATTPQPNDHSRSRSPVRGDSRLFVGSALIGISMNPGTNARLALYLRHEDRARCWIVPSLARPQENPAPWQELRVLNPDGAIVAGGSGINDTGTFFTGVKNSVARGVNSRWVVEVSWRGTPATGYPPSGVTPNVFGVLCESTSGASAMLPLALGTDDF